MEFVQESRRNSSSDECVVLSLSPPEPGVPSSTDMETPKRSTSKIRLSKAESEKRKSEREAKRAEEEAARAEKKRQKDELKAKRAEEKARKAEELQLEKARKAEELQLEKARKAEEMQLEKARKAEEMQLEKARRAEEKARKEAENADKKAEIKQKKEQRQAAAQKQELLNKQMANYMGKFFKPIEKSSTIKKDGSNNPIAQPVIEARCTDEFDSLVSKQDTNFISNLLETLSTMKRIEVDISSRLRLNSDSNSNQTTTTSSYLIKTRYIHFPEKYFNRPPYYGSFKKSLTVQIDPLKPDASIDNIDYTVDSEGEWEEPCKDGEELRSDAEDDVSDSETMDSDSDTDSFIVPHGHLSDDELNEDEQQQSELTKQAREVAKSHDWNKKVARRHQQREIKPIFGCIYDSNLDEKCKIELTTYLNQFRKIFVPKECCPRPEPDEKDEENHDETTGPKEEKVKRMSKKKSLIAKKGLSNDLILVQSTTSNATKRTGSASNINESASPSKRRKMNSNENCSLIDDNDVMMTDLETLNSSKGNVLEDTSNVTEMKSTSPILVHCVDDVKVDVPSTCTLLVPKRKQTQV